MEITELTLRIIILLLPGIFGTFIVEKLHYREELDLKTFVISVIMLGFSSYFLLLGIKNLIEIFMNGLVNYHFVNIHFFNVLIGKEENLIYSEVLYATLIGIVIGIISAAIINRGLFYSFFRKLHVTNSTGQDVWAEVFDNSTKGIKKFVYVVDDEANRVYGGWVKNYSKDSKEVELLLEDVIVSTNSPREDLYRVQEAYIKNNKDKLIIEMKASSEEEI